MLGGVARVLPASVCSGADGPPFLEHPPEARAKPAPRRRSASPGGGGQGRGVLAEGAISLSVTLSGDVMFAS